MDNRKWYNRFASIFWWCLTILPLIIALIYFIGFHLTFNSGMTSAIELSNYHQEFNGNFLNYLEDVLMENIMFGDWCLPFVNTMFFDLFNSLGVVDFDYLGVLFGWMVSVQFYHLLFDFIVWLPQWFHRIMEKGMDKLS